MAWSPTNPARLLPGARVTVSNAAGPVKSATAGNDGSYSIVGLDAGNLHGTGYLARASSKLNRRR